MPNLEQHKEVIVYYDVLKSSDELTSDEHELHEAAFKAMDLSYSPYSRFRVGAAVRLKDGSIISGANQENASYGLTICAERSTLFTANNLGKGDEVTAIAIIGAPENGESNEPVAPCGACRQVIREFEDRSGMPIKVLFSGTQGPILRFNNVGDLLPFSFGPRDLAINPRQS